MGRLHQLRRRQCHRQTNESTGDADGNGNDGAFGSAPLARKTDSIESMQGGR